MVDQAERTGLIFSGAGHGVLILWALIGGLFNFDDDQAAITSTEVSLISSAEFAAMQAAAPTAVTEAPEEIALPEAQPEVAEPEPVEEAEPEVAEPAPEPEPVAEPDTAPDVSEITPPETVVEDTPPEEITAPPADMEFAAATPVLNTRPKAAPRVAPAPSEAPEPDAEVSEAAQAEVSEQPTETPVEEPAQEEAAPEESGQVLETEENQEQTDVASSAAPATSARPKSRPEKPVETAAAEPVETATETATETPTEDAVAGALAEALAGGEVAEEATAGTGAAPDGPPLTTGEKDALVVAVKQCWNVGALSTDALRTVVTVGVTMGQDGKPDGGSIRMIGYEGGDDASARQAYEAGRRAIMRCGAKGFPLPPEKYDQWREVEIVFNPEKMRMK